MPADAAHRAGETAKTTEAQKEGPNIAVICLMIGPTMALFAGYLMGVANPIGGAIPVSAL